MSERTTTPLPIPPPLPLRLTIDFAITLAEFQEANRAHAIAIKRSGTPVWAVRLVIAAMIAAMIAASTASQWWFGTDKWVMFISIPLIVVAVFVTSILRKPGRQPSEQFIDVPRSARWKRFLSVLMFVFSCAVAVIMLIFLWEYYQEPVSRGSASPTGTTGSLKQQDVLFAVAAACFAPIIALASMYRRDPATRLWQRSPWMWTPRRMDFDERGIVLNEGQSPTQLPWLSILSTIETANLFLLNPNGGEFLIVPKRVFDSTALDRFRALLSARVQPKTGGFPILPVSESIPLPLPPPSPVRQDQSPGVFEFEFDLTVPEAREAAQVRSHEVSPARAAAQLFTVWLTVTSLYFMCMLVFILLLRPTIALFLVVPFVAALMAMVLARVVYWRTRRPISIARSPSGTIITAPIQNPPVRIMTILTVLMIVTVIWTLPRIVASWLHIETFRHSVDVFTLRIVPIVLMMLASITWAGVSNLRRKPSRNRPLRLELSDERVIVDGKAGRTERSWTDISSYLESPHLFMLYFSDGPITVPKRLFSFDGAQSVDAFCDLLRRHIP